MDHLANLLVPLGALAASYGALNARISNTEKCLDLKASKSDFSGLSGRLDDVVDELRGLRSDLTLLMTRFINGPKA